MILSDQSTAEASLMESREQILRDALSHLLAHLGADTPATNAVRAWYGPCVRHCHALVASTPPGSADGHYWPGCPGFGESSRLRDWDAQTFRREFARRVGLPVQVVREIEDACRTRRPPAAGAAPEGEG